MVVNYTGVSNEGFLLNALKTLFRLSRVLLDIRGFPSGGFQSLSVELGFYIAIVSGIPDSLNCIPDSKAQDM